MRKDDRDVGAAWGLARTHSRSCRAHVHGANKARVRAQATASTVPCRGPALASRTSIGAHTRANIGAHEHTLPIGLSMHTNAQAMLPPMHHSH